MATKTGGRKAGTPNKKTVELLARLNEMDWDPLRELHELSQEARACGDLANAIKANVGVLNYVYPKRRSIDLANDSAPLQLVVATGIPHDSPKKLPDETQALLDKLGKLRDSLPDE